MAQAQVSFSESPQLYGCIHCGRPVGQPGYACEDCAEEQLPPELQKREGDTVTLIRSRQYKWPALQGVDPAEKPILLRPKNQEEKNDLHIQRTQNLNSCADLIEKSINFNKSAEGATFWLGVTRMLREKAHEFDPTGPMKKKG